MNQKSITSEPGYFATDLGTVIGPRGRTLKPRIKVHGYPFVKVHNKWRRLHILIAEAFHGPRPSNLETMHLNSNKLDSRPENLRYGTKSENARMAVAIGRKGQVMRDKSAEIETATGTYREIAKRLGVSKTTVVRVKNKSHWTSG